MEAFLNGVSAVSVIFLLMVVGYFLGRAGWITKQEKKFISRFCINIALPCNCFRGIMTSMTRESVLQSAYLFLVPFLTISTSLLIAALAALVLKIRRSRRGVFIASCFLSNTIFVGVPMITQLFGDEGIPDLMIYWMISTLFTQSVVLLLVEYSGKQQVSGFHPLTFLKDIVTKPPIVATAAGYVCLISGIRMPEVIMNTARYLASTVSPLSLIYCGYIVWEMGLKNIRMEKEFPLLLFLRLVLSPILCLVYCRLLGVDGLMRNVFIVASALPVVTQIPVLAGLYGADEQYAVSASVLSMLVMFVTIPVIMMLL